MIENIKKMENSKRMNEALKEVEKMPVDKEPNFKIVAIIGKTFFGNFENKEDSKKTSESVAINLDEIKDVSLKSGVSQKDFEDSITLLNAMGILTDGKNEGLSNLNCYAFRRIYRNYMDNQVNYTQSEEPVHVLSKGARK